ncbi:MAG: alpha/beta hydrolase [Verrucomicrobiae bacterium]|nr:alpha/beta hydrolase [Verrucomicrobiae bacterium]
MKAQLWRIIRTLACVGVVAIAYTQARDSTPYNQITNVVYAEVHGTGLLMDVFIPRDKTNGLAIVDVVSGAWFSDRGKIRDHERAGLFDVLCGRGYTVFAIRPGSVSRYTAFEMADHIRTGIRYVKANAEKYRIAPESIGLTGASAGGHLAALVALTPESGDPGTSNALRRHDTAVKAVSVFFPPTDFLDWNGRPAPVELLGRLLFIGGAANKSEDEIKKAAIAISPVSQVRQQPPPFLIFHGDADPLVPLQQSKKLVEALKAAGGKAELVVKSGGGHPWPTIREEVEVMAKWFDEALANK